MTMDLLTGVARCLNCERFWVLQHAAPVTYTSQRAAEIAQAVLPSLQENQTERRF